MKERHLVAQHGFAFHRNQPRRGQARTPQLRAPCPIGIGWFAKGVRSDGRQRKAAFGGKNKLAQLMAQRPGPATLRAQMRQGHSTGTTRGPRPARQRRAIDQFCYKSHHSKPSHWHKHPRVGPRLSRFSPGHTPKPQPRYRVSAPSAFSSVAEAGRCGVAARISSISCITTRRPATPASGLFSGP